MRIISAICSFIYMNSATLTLEAEGSLVDISLARDLVVMGSQRDGNLDCFLWAIFSLYNPREEKTGMGKEWGTFENLTEWKHKTNGG